VCKREEREREREGARREATAEGRVSGVSGVGGLQRAARQAKKGAVALSAGRVWGVSGEGEDSGVVGSNKAAGRRC
jgi:hypothetical protein